MKIFILLFLLCKFAKGQFNTCTPPSFPEKCGCFVPDSLLCQDFNLFTELDFKNNKDPSKTFKRITLSPSSQIDFDSDLDLEGLSIDTTASFYLSNIRSFSFMSNPLDNFTNFVGQSNELIVEISDSVFDFTYNNQPFTSRCNLVTIESLPSTFNSFFAEFKEIRLKQSVKYLGEVCPIIFKDAKISNLLLENLDSTSNQIIFQKVSQSNRRSFNATIKRLEISNSNIDLLDTKLLNTDIFYELEELSFIDSTIQEVDESLFSNFGQLNTLLFYLENFKDFIINEKSEYNKWMSNLNKGSSEEFLIGFIDSASVYTYPDQDFCFFVNFPHQAKVFPYIRSKDNLDCTCTLVWLFQFYDSSKFSSLILSSDSVYNCLSNEQDFKNKIISCNFNDKINRCFGITTAAETTTEVVETTALPTTFQTTAMLIETTLVIETTQEEITQTKSLSSINIFFITLGCLMILTFSAGLISYYFYKRSRRINVGEAHKMDILSENKGQISLVNEMTDMSNDKKHIFFFYNKIRSLVEANKEKLETSYSIVSKYHKIISNDKYDYYPIKTDHKHKIIILDETKPINIKEESMKIFTQNTKYIMEKHLEDLLRRQIIRPSTSKWASPSLFDPQLGFFVDYSYINGLTKLLDYKIDNMDSYVEKLKASNFYSRINLHSGTYMIGLDDSSIEKTAFITTNGQFEYVVMPHGLLNSNQTFKIVFETILKEYLNEFCLVYFNSIIIFSDTTENHKTHVDLILNQLMMHDVKVNLEDIEVDLKEILIYNNLIKNNEIHYNYGTISIINNYPIPNSLKELRRFLKLVSFYKDDLENYEKLIAQFEILLSLSKSKFEWFEKHTILFNQMKKNLVKILSIDLSKVSTELTLYTSQNQNEFNCSLTTKNSLGKDFPLAFYHEKNSFNLYSSNSLFTLLNQVIDNRLLCIMWSLNHFDAILYGKQFNLSLLAHYEINRFKSLTISRSSLKKEWIFYTQKHRYLMKNNDEYPAKILKYIKFNSDENDNEIENDDS